MFSFTPIDMIASPNVFSVQTNWAVSSGSPTTLWFQLVSNDSLPQRRFLADPAATLKLTFMRARKASLDDSVAQTFSVLAVPLANDLSVWSVPLSESQVGTLISGTVILEYTVGGVTLKVSRSFSMKKSIVGPGC